MFLTVPGLGRPYGAYSHLAEVNGMVYSSGIGPMDPATGTVPEGITAQAEAAVDNLETGLAAVGLTLRDVVKVTVVIEDFAANFAAVNEVYARRFPQPYPVRTVLGAALPGPLVAMDIMAARPAP
ncbi:RidA family protein [Pseudarthrobacter sp. P1]|uniref:RidA family protein n=1 Tax=Pseudarthrobacter sp. P1 TaxID=3418418 RepID=UPI003CF72716